MQARAAHPALHLRRGSRRHRARGAARAAQRRARRDARPPDRAAVPDARDRARRPVVPADQRALRRRRTASSRSTPPCTSASRRRPAAGSWSRSCATRRRATCGRAPPRSRAWPTPRARARRTRDELSGSTITITSLGPLGGIVTTPIINAPEVAIVGVNRIVERPVIRGGAIVPRKLMNLSSSFDHRVVDGQDAAEFVQALRGYLECPAMLFVD